MQGPVKQYLLNSNFHGLRYIGEDDRHWTEKIFWLVCFIASWVASGLLMRASWINYKYYAISFVVETDYLHWDTHFPSVAVCETDNPDRIAAVTDILFGEDHDFNLDEIVKELAFFRGLSYYMVQICGSNTQEAEKCPKNNFTIYPKLVRSPCKDIFSKCKWNDEEFDCCKYFLPIDTEVGVCYAINSLHARGKRPPRLTMISNHQVGQGNMLLELFGSSNVYIHGEEDSPSLSSQPSDLLSVSPYIHYRRFIAIKEIANEPEVKDVSIASRSCRYPYETMDVDVVEHYSYGGCTVQCRKDAHLRYCNCTHHLMPNTKPSQHCDLNGLACLNKEYGQVAVMKPHWANRPGLVCDCLPSCTEMERGVVRDEKVGIVEELAIAEISLERLPTERYKRNVVHGKLDLVVSMGGTAGLFLGASILSLVELFYFFSFRLKKSKEEELQVEKIDEKQNQVAHVTASSKLPRLD